ncbi:MAG: hypothetical protein JO184_12910 [Gammaproteobacteria bacterium]|nr:hypothetical protein [Gammaproteobacteria bacterium]MBV8307415.1 hypothetical protein [Gammaproteobacteria bacterium]MBV8402637.1 hypothetical protein [Gammaproteobacteria bacterium]
MRPELETGHAAHPTGRRWLDLTLALSAMFVSLISLAVAVHHGNAMDRLVEANSWPFLTYGTGDLDDQGRRRIWLKVDNAGVGPARIESFEVWWHEQPIASADELLKLCCLKDATLQLDPATMHAMRMNISTVAPSVLRAGDELTFLSLERTDSNAETWDRLDLERVQIRMRACYCSVFDECWLADLRQTSAREVRSCPTAKVPFSIPMKWFDPPRSSSGRLH